MQDKFSKVGERGKDVVKAGHGEADVDAEAGLELKSCKSVPRGGQDAIEAIDRDDRGDRLDSRYDRKKAKTFYLFAFLPFGCHYTNAVLVSMIL